MSAVCRKRNGAQVRNNTNSHWAVCPLRGREVFLSKSNNSHTFAMGLNTLTQLYTALGLAGGELAVPGLYLYHTNTWKSLDLRATLTLKLQG